jgi:hypothetical protein
MKALIGDTFGVVANDRSSRERKNHVLHAD